MKRRLNRRHPEDAIEVPKGLGRIAAKLLRKAPRKYQEAFRKATASREGKRALRKFQQFWGIPLPPEIEVVPGGSKLRVQAGMASVPQIVVHDGKRKRTIRGNWRGAFDGSGRRITLFKRRGLPKRPRWRYLGRVVETHYVPSKSIERAGSFKKGTHWVHEHHDERGKWPRAFVDQAGNVRYARGTYRINKWIRR